MKQFIATVMALLHISAFAKDNDGKVVFTEEQKATLIKHRGENFTNKFIAAIQKDSEGATTDPAVVGELLSELNAHVQTSLDSQARLRADLDAANLAKQKAENDRIASEGKITNLEAKVAKLEAKPEPDPDPKTPGADAKNWNPSGKDTHLFGRSEAHCAIDDKRPFNQRAYAMLLKKKGISYMAPEATNIDYDSIKSDLGDFYRVRKQDQIQSFVAKLPGYEGIFPMESNIQDQAVLVNLFLEEFTQADNSSSEFDNVVKGSYKFESEVITMYPVMLATKFTQLKELERNWLGYLNREGSDTMKWSFIEYIMVETLKQVMNEYNIRVMRGVRKNPDLNVAGVSIQASNGLLKFIKNQVALFKIKPFAVGEWSSSTIVNYVKNCTRMIPAVYRDSGRVICYMSTDAFTDYIANYETLYGSNMDYRGPVKTVKDYESVRIIVVPNMAPSKRIIWTLEGNIIRAEDKSGEMLNIFFEQQDWKLKAWANWKESVWAYKVGKKFASAAAMPSDYSSQVIWCNDVDEPADFYLNMDKDDTTPSVLNHTSLVSVANSQATAITTFDDAVVGQEIRIKCGNDTHAVTIAASGNFSLLSAAWTPALGDEIRLIKRSDGKFIETLRTTASSAAIAFAANDTSPSVAEGDTFVTVANGQATAITTLDDAITGKTYRIYGGSSTNASTIANSGNFSLTAAMTLSLGLYIDLRLSATDSKFYEVTRG